MKSKTLINVRSFIAALVIIGVLMVAAYVATLMIPCQGIAFWQWILSPILVLTSNDRLMLIGLLVFLLILGGVFNALSYCGLMNYMINKIAAAYGEKRYKLLGIVEFFFMALGSCVGSFEEVVPMVPILVTLAVELGWDAITGLYMSLLAAGCGFAAGVFNPFSVGIAQSIAGLPMFSGAWFRVINFVFIYGLLLLFTTVHAKRVDKGEKTVERLKTFVRDEKKDKGVLFSAIVMGLGIIILLSTAVITVLRDYSFVIITFMFLIAGIGGALISGVGAKEFGASFGAGVVSMLPGILLILMASSIKYTLETAGALDFIVNKAIEIIAIFPSWSVILFIYLFVLIMNFLIPSGSAKAIMVMPLLLPMADAFGISRQLLVVAYAFGDGFSNTFYATNPATLISLSLADTSYGTWFKNSGRFQILNLMLTSGLLLLGLVLGV